MKRHAYVVKGKERAAARFQCSKPKLCDNASCTVDDITEIVKQALKEAIADFELRVEAKEDDSLEVQRQLVQRLERRLEELAELEVKQWDEKIKGIIPPHIFEKLNNDLLKEREDVTEALCTAKDSAPEPIDFKERLTTFHAVLDLLDDPDAPAAEVNKLLKKCIERITYKRPRMAVAHARWRTGAEIELDISLRV